MTPPMTNDLIERLRKVDYFPSIPDTPLPINPDGPEAAAHIEALAERVRELEGACLALDNAMLDLRDAFVRDGTYSGARGAAIKAMNAAITRARQARKDKGNDTLTSL